MKPILLPLSLILSVSAHAHWSELKPTEFRLAAPPVAGSVDEKRDQDEVLYEEKVRAEGACLLGNAQTLPDFRVLFGPESGLLTTHNMLSYSEYAAVSSTMRRVFYLTHQISSRFKKQFGRPRPYQTLKQLSPCLYKPGYNDSYPSTHAALGAVGACLLAKKFPHKSYELKQQGYLVGELRVIGGVHHPSDVKAGQELATQICERLSQDASFRKELGLSSL